MRYIFLDMVDDAVVLSDPAWFFKRTIQDLQKRLRELGVRRVWLEDGTWCWDIKPDLKPGGPSTYEQQGKGDDLIRTARRIVARDLRGAMDEGDFQYGGPEGPGSCHVLPQRCPVYSWGRMALGHDVGKIFTEVVRTRGIAAEEGLLQKVAYISMRLAAERAPAF